MYAVYHGPEGVKAIAERVHGLTAVLAAGLQELGHGVLTNVFFDTIAVRGGSEHGVDQWVGAALDAGMNLRRLSPTEVGVALDEVSSPEEVSALLGAFGGERGKALSARARERVDSPRPRSGGRALTQHPCSQHRPRRNPGTCARSSRAICRLPRDDRSAPAR